MRLAVRCALLSLLPMLHLGLLGPGGAVTADEGMWLFNNPPRDMLRKKYQLELTDSWLEHVQKASVRFNNGGSGSFVSCDGLVITNHHIGADSLQKLSPKDADYLHDGYFARSQAEELACPDLELNVLQSIEDVTARVNFAVKPDASPAEAAVARRAVMAIIEKESLEKTGLRSDVVTLYQGGLYHIYLYKKYTDVRLVFAPEHAIASFGGDVDNFEFPRHSLDICFFRVYEHGKPAQIQHYLKWSPSGPQAGDLVFVSGHPGTTNRMETLARLEERRDHALPYFLNRLRCMEALLSQFSERSPAHRRMARHDLNRVANTRKASQGQFQGLLDPTILAHKAAEEQELRKRVDENPSLRAQCSYAWDRIAAVQKSLVTFEYEHALLETGHAFDSQLFKIARHLVRLADEKRKPSAERLRDYRDSNLESLQLEIFSPAPIQAELERAKLGGSLTFLAEVMGGGHPEVKKIFAGKSPAARAAEVVSGTKLFDSAERKRIAAGGLAAIVESSDPMILLARLVDDRARLLRKRFENEVEEVERQAYSQIAKARFELLGTTVAPDATFTLRLAFGVAKGYKVDGVDVPFTTTLAGAFSRAEEMGTREPFELPRRWIEGKAKLDPQTPFNFAATSDTIGGNSGSPVLNRAAELVGINFDRNRHGLVRNFVYSEEQARHISVHSRGILEVLRKLYGADSLVRELTAG